MNEESVSCCSALWGSLSKDRNAEVGCGSSLLRVGWCGLPITRVKLTSLPSSPAAVGSSPVPRPSQQLERWFFVFFFFNFGFGFVFFPPVCILRPLSYQELSDTYQQLIFLKLHTASALCTYWGSDLKCFLSPGFLVWCLLPHKIITDCKCWYCDLILCTKKEALCSEFVV